MLSVQRQYELLAFEAGEASVVSFYLDAERARDPAAARALLAELAGRAPELQPLGEDLAALDRFLAESWRPPEHRGLAAFSCARRAFFIACGLPQPVPTQVSVAPRPRIEPLTNLLAQYRRYGVALTDGAAVRLAEVYLGEAREVAGAPRPLRAPRPSPAPLQRGLAELAGWIVVEARRRGWERLVLAAPAAVADALAEQLPGTLRDSVILEPALPAASGLREVRDRVVACEREARKVRESVLVHRLEDQVRTGGPAVLGFEATLDAVCRGAARLVLVRDGFTKLGRLCPGCGSLALSGKTCPDCSRPTEQVFDLAGEMTRLALEQGAEVFRILYDPRLDGLGKVGAELRGPAPQGPARSPRGR